MVEKLLKMTLSDTQKQRYIEFSHWKDAIENVNTIVKRRSKIVIIKTEFLIAICRPPGDKGQSKALFVAIFYPVCRLLRAFLIAAYPVWFYLFIFQVNKLIVGPR